MAFLILRDSLTPRPRSGHLIPATKVLHAHEHAVLVEATGLLTAARTEAVSIVSRAQEAYAAERERGYSEGQAAALREQAQAITRLTTRTVDYFGAVESQLVDLVMGALRKIIDDYDDREKIVIVVRNALSVVRNQKQMTLRLNPGEVEVVRNRIDALLAPYPAAGYLDILPDARLCQGTCILESEIGMVEAGLEQQLQAMQAAFQDALAVRT